MTENSVSGNTGITSTFGTLWKNSTDVFERYKIYRGMGEVGDILRRIICRTGITALYSIGPDINHLYHPSSTGDKM